MRSFQTRKWHVICLFVSSTVEIFDFTRLPKWKPYVKKLRLSVTHAQFLNQWSVSRLFFLLSCDWSWHPSFFLTTLHHSHINKSRSVLNNFTNERYRREAELDSNNEQQTVSRGSHSGKHRRGSRRRLVLLEHLAGTGFGPTRGLKSFHRNR